MRNKRLLVAAYPAMMVLLVATNPGCRRRPVDLPRSEVPVQTQQIGNSDDSKKPGAQVDATLTPYSGRFGFHVSGPHALDGSITKDELTDSQWKFDATLEFPTSGYDVQEPRVTVRESYPEQVVISIPVSSPPPGARVTKMPVRAKLSANVSASNEAQFRVVFEEG